MAFQTTYRIEPVTLADRTIIANIASHANTSNPYTQAAWANASFETRRAAAYARFPTDLLAEGAWFMRAVNDNGVTVAHAQWTLPNSVWRILRDQYPLKVTAERRKQYADEYENSCDSTTGRPKGINPRAHLKKMDEVRERVQPSQEIEPHIELDQMRTLPDHQRQGAGKALLRWGIQFADRTGLSIYLEATPEGVRLYDNFGFERLADASEDLSQFGGPHSYTHVFMTRRPQPGEAGALDGAQ